MNHPLIKSSASWDITQLTGNHFPAITAAISSEPLKLSIKNSGSMTTLNAWIAIAAEQFMFNSNPDMALIRIGLRTYASEWRKANGTIILAYANQQGEINASVLSQGKNGYRYAPVPEIGNTNDDFDTTSILLCLMGILSESPDEAVRNQFMACMDAWKKGTPAETVENAIFVLSDLMQSMLSSDELKAIVKNGAIDLLSRSRVSAKAFTGELICGSSKILMPGEATMLSGGGTVGDLKKKYASYAASRTWSKEDEMRIPDYPDDYFVPDEISEIADWYFSSRTSLLPANNFCWRGVTGCGKSTGAELLACILHVPLFRMTCHTTMETQDFLSTLVPAEREDTGADLPMFEDMELDPAYAFKQMTGKTKENATSQECLEEYAKIVAARAGKGTYFKRVNSEFVQALEKGAVCEISEASRIRDSGVLVGINNFDKPGSLIPLIDGSYARRHKDALVLWTDNTGYSSCRPIDPSVLRRMAAIYDTFELDKGAILKRVRYNTKSKLDNAAIDQMYDIWNKIRVYLHDEEITEGDISPSDLENWVLRTELAGMGEIIPTCRKTIVSKCTTDREEQERIVSTIVVPLVGVLENSR